MKRHAMNKQRISLVTLVMIFAIALLGCDKEVTIRTNNFTGENGTPGEDNNGPDPQDNHPTPDPDEDETHGPDDDQVIIEPGFLNGSWRVATAEDDRPLVYLDFFHDDGESEVTGTYWMGNAISDILDGEAGDILTGTWSSDVLVVHWNPTMDEEEVYKITNARRISEDRLEGTFSAEKDPLTFEVVIDRRVYDNEPDEDEFGDGE